MLTLASGRECTLCNARIAAAAVRRGCNERIGGTIRQNGRGDIGVDGPVSSVWRIGPRTGTDDGYSFG